jgi:hypothetical protein
MPSEKPWGSFTAADYTAEQWIAACLINLNAGPRSSWSKGKAKLPVREPSGALNRNGVHAAAAVLAGARGGVDAPPDVKRAAARKLLGLYAQLKETAPDSVRRMAA